MTEPILCPICRVNVSAKYGTEIAAMYPGLICGSCNAKQ